MNQAEWLEQLLAIARNGLHYAENGYDRERYERLQSLCQQGYAELADMDVATLRRDLVHEWGQVTPLVGADAAIFNADGQILLMDRVDGSGWCLPCGWVEAGEEPSAAAVRETFEETGLIVEVERLAGVFSRPAGMFGNPRGMIAVVHLCRVVGGELTLSHEGLDLKYWQLDEVPRWHANHRDYAEHARAMWQDPDLLAVSR